MSYREKCRVQFAAKRLDDGADPRDAVSMLGLAALAKDLKLWPAATSCQVIAVELRRMMLRERRQRTMKPGKRSARR